MNRKIEFRGKPIEALLPNGELLTGKWVYGYLIILSTGEYRILSPCSEGFKNYKVAPSSVGQNTGIIDKNGKFVFEGDIVKYYEIVSSGGDWENGIPSENYIKETEEEIIYEQGSFGTEGLYFKCLYDEGFWEGSTEYIDDCLNLDKYPHIKCDADLYKIEVIGNTFDNP